MTRKETDRLYGGIVEFSGLEDFIDTPVRHYSSGMYVRLGFSVAVHVDPEILMVDEVIAVGDAEFQRRCHEHFYKLKSQGTTIVIVTHGLSEVKAMCDEAAWLDHGSLRAVGPASEIVRGYTDVVNLAEAERHGREQDGDVDQGESTAAVVAIDRVHVVGAGGRPRPVLSPHDPVAIQVDYTMKRPVDDARLRFSIYNSQDFVVAATGTDQVCPIPATARQGPGPVRHPLAARSGRATTRCPSTSPTPTASSPTTWPSEPPSCECAPATWKSPAWFGSKAAGSRPSLELDRPL